MTVQIDDSRLEDNLPNEIMRILRTMFSECEKAIILSEFPDGQSDGRVFLVRPVYANGPELRSVVKVDFVEAIKKEWEAYQTCIQHRLPRTAVIHGEPVYPPGNSMGGLWYSLAGDGVFEINSLAAYARQANISEVEKVLKRLLQSLDGLWGPQKYVEPELYLRTVYDSFLPANLFIEATSPSQGEEVHWLHPNTIRNRSWKVGDYVLISGFFAEEKDRQQKQFMFNMSGPFSFRLNLQSVVGLDEYEISQEIYEPIYGKITQTRMGLLREKVAEVVGSVGKATQTHFSIAHGTQLPNPFMEIETILEQSFDAYKACLHGDLHLKNILVEPNSGEVYLVAFGKSGRDYIMRDLLHLEMSIVTELLAEKLPLNDQLPDAMYEFYTTLHCMITHSKIVKAPGNTGLPFAMLVQLRETARHYLFKANQWESYYNSLCLHLLGALKFSSLSDAAKQVAFWGSAAILKLVQDPPDCAPTQAMSGERAEIKPAEPDEGRAGGKYDITIQGGQGIVIGDHNQITQTFTERIQKRKVSTNTAVINLELAIDYHQFTLEEQDRFISDLSRIIGIDPDDVCILAIDLGSVIITLEVPEEAAAILESMFLREEFELRTLRITKVESSRHPMKGKVAKVHSDNRRRCSTSLEHIDLTKLRECIVIYFNESELKDICFDLRVDYESLLGQGKSDKARELVAFFERRGQIDELVSILCRRRPKIAILDLIK